MKNKERKIWIVCPKCKYHNQKELVDRFGTCKFCNKVLDEKAKFKYEMFTKLRLWRNKKWQKF